MHEADAGHKPAPLTPANCVLSDFEFMPLQVKRLRDSEFAAVVSDAAFRAGVLLWCAAWEQSPCASLPNDDRQLAQLAGFGRVVDAWLAVREEALHGFVLCSDERLYHSVVAEQALKAHIERLRAAIHGAAGNKKRWGSMTDPAKLQADLDDAVLRLLAINPNAKVRLPKKASAQAESGGDQKTIGGRQEEDRVATENQSLPDQKTSQPTGTGIPTGTGTERTKKEEKKFLSFDEGWSLDPVAVAVAEACGFSHPEIDALDEQHRTWWKANQPDARKTRDGWALAWRAHCEAVAADPGKRARLKPAAAKPLMLEPPPLPDGPPWWREACAKIAAAYPNEWLTAWSGCRPLDEGVVAAPSALIAQRINSGQLGAQAARVGVEIHAVDPADAKPRAVAL